MSGNSIWKWLVKISGWETWVGSMKHRYNPKAVDAAQFNDALASRVSWKPIKHTGLLFPRRLRRIDHRCSFHLRRFFVLAVLLAPLLLSAIVYKVWFLFLSLLIVLYPLTLVLLYLGSPPVWVDKRKGYFCKGRGRKSDYINLDEIHALQLLSYFHLDGDPGNAGVVYQLNLVCKTGRRVELVTQRTSPIKRARAAKIEDAKALALFLEVPLWNAISEHDR